MTDFWTIVLAILVARLIWNIVICPVAQKTTDFFDDVKAYAKKNEEAEKKSPYSPPKDKSTIGFKMKADLH